MPRNITLKENNRITPCPQCNNNTDFICHSEQVAEDACNVWVVCKCGFDPTADDTGSRLEDVWGGCDNDNAFAALMCWNDAIADSATRRTEAMTG